MLAILLAALESEADKQRFSDIYTQYHLQMEQTALRILKKQHDAVGNVLTAAELNQNLPQIVADYNERFSHSKPCPLYGSVKDYAASCADLQQLYEAVGWAAEGELYAEA